MVRSSICCLILSASMDTPRSNLFGFFEHSVAFDMNLSYEFSNFEILFSCV